MSYSPTLGRWKEQDPEGYVDGSNSYLYVRGNPVKFNDPHGLQAKQSAEFSSKDFDLIVTVYNPKDPHGASGFTRELQQCVEKNPGMSLLSNATAMEQIAKHVKELTEAKRDATGNKDARIKVIVAGHGSAQGGPSFGHATTGDAKRIFDREWSDRHQIISEPPNFPPEPEEDLAKLKKAAPTFFDMRGYIEELTFTGCSLAADETSRYILGLVAKGLDARVRAFKSNTRQNAGPNGIRIVPEVKDPNQTRDDFVFEVGP